MKEFTKMARWKDTSFWSVKAIVDKSRKMMHKTMREYQKAISKPAREHFMEVEEQAGKGREDTGKSVTIAEVLVAGEKEVVVAADVTVRSQTGKEFGSLAHLTRRAVRWCGNMTAALGRLEVASVPGDMVVEVVEEMETLRGLVPDLKKSQEEQKKQAGFIQQRKRARLNDLFKTLQQLGLSYRFGLSSCGAVRSYREMFVHATMKSAHWERAECYFYRCFARFRQLSAVVDGVLPQGVSPVLGERFQVRVWRP